MSSREEIANTLSGNTAKFSNLYSLSIQCDWIRKITILVFIHNRGQLKKKYNSGAESWNISSTLGLTITKLCDFWHINSPRVEIRTVNYFCAHTRLSESSNGSRNVTWAESSRIFYFKTHLSIKTPISMGSANGSVFTTQSPAIGLHSVLDAKKWNHVIKMKYVWNWSVSSHAFAMVHNPYQKRFQLSTFKFK